MMEKSPVILIARGDSMGDVVLSTVLITPLKERYPDAAIYFLIKPQYHDIIAPLKDVAGVIDDPFTYAKNAQDEEKITQLASQLQPYNIDIFIGAWETPRYAKLSKKLNVPIRIGYATSWTNRRLYTHTVPLDPTAFEVHQTQWLLNLLTPLGITHHVNINDGGNRTVDSNADTIRLHCAEYEWPKAIPYLDRPFTCMIIGAKNRQKQLLPNHAITVINRTIEATQSPVVVLGPSAEIPELKAQLNNIHHPELLIDATDIPLKDSIGILRHAALVCSSDTGMAHIAAALKKPMVVWFINKTQNLFRWRPFYAYTDIVMPYHTCPDKCDSIACQKTTCRDGMDLSQLLTKIKSRWNEPKKIDLYAGFKSGASILVIENSDELSKTLRTQGMRVVAYPPSTSWVNLCRIGIDHHINIIIMSSETAKDGRLKKIPKKIIIKCWVARWIISNTNAYLAKILSLSSKSDISDVMMCVMSGVSVKK